jgi:hypothetical protein
MGHSLEARMGAHCGRQEASVIAIFVLRKAYPCTSVQNILVHGTGGLNIDQTRVGDETMVECRATPSGSGCYAWNREKGNRPEIGDPSTYHGRYPSNLMYVFESGVGDAFPDAGGGMGVRGIGSSTVYGGGKGYVNALPITGQSIGYGDSGSAHRFFQPVRVS